LATLAEHLTYERACVDIAGGWAHNTRVMKASSIAVAVATMAVGLTFPWPASAATCESLRSLSLPNVTITQATIVGAGQFSPPGSGGKIPPAAAKLPGFCRVAATLTPTRDSDIKIEVWMPSEGWNGKFLGVGNGGWAGSISYPAMSESLVRGYAVASTDTGHAGGGGDASFALGHPEKLIDFGYRAVHEMTAAAKAFVRAFYEAAPRFSYWNGCSTGGKQGLTEAQRFPADYDGIVAGAPANNWTRLMTGLMWAGRATLSDSASRIPADKFAVLNRAALNACDAEDGVTDGVIENPRSCRFDPQVVACTNGSDGAECLTAAQVDAARKIYGPAMNPRTGEALYPGLPPGSEPGWSAAAGGPAPFAIPDSHFKYVVFADPKWDFRTLDFDRDIARAERVDNGILTAVNPDLSAFANRGGKLLMYHGWNDQLITAHNSVNYYESVRSELGPARTDATVRLFMAPGMAHCSGGPGPNQADWLAVLEQWVETGVAPTRIIASRSANGVVVRARPLCAYPQVARYTGKGSTNEAANFSCVAPDERR
jgi:feruloyl esterase